MPVGSFFAPAATSRSLMGTGSPSQPRSSSGGDPTWGTATGANSWATAPATQYPQTRQQADSGALGSTTYMPPNYQTLAQQASGRAATAPPSGNDWMQSAATAYNGPNLQSAVNWFNRQIGQIGQVPVDIEYQKSLLNRDSNLAQRSLSLDRQQIGVQQDLSREQLANLGRLRGILGQQYGLQGEQLANQLAGLQVDEDKTRDLSARSIWDLRSQLTARGAYNTIANERGTGRANRDLGYALRGIDVNRQAADIANRGNVLGLNEKGIGYDNQAAGLNSKLSSLGLDLSKVGLNEEQLANSLTDGINQLGLGGMATLNGLIDNLTSPNSPLAQISGTVLQQVLGTSNLPPELAAQIAAALGLQPPAASSTLQSQSTPPL